MRLWLRSCIVILSSACMQGQDAQSARDWATLVGQRYEIVRDVVYKNIGGFQAKVDVYTRYDRKPGPTMIYIHGGGWANGSKEQYALWFLPYLQLGMRVVSVQYRLAGVAPAPAAVKDCRCALYWVFQNAEKYGFDRTKIALTGGSAGGHLVLLAGMLRPSDGFDDECSGEQPGRIAAIVNYYGPTDLVNALDGNVSLQKWLKPGKDQRELARRLSPLTYVRKDLPPVLTIHGDSDEMVPYQDAVKLRAALDSAHVPNELITIPGGKHGRFRWTDADILRAQRAIEVFLRKYALTQ
ncbi:MAG: alpha/beta hydrolase [Acidobacteriota bacterium]|nr:alpha/beta hydrolase [Acidobacteriota bacterium]